MLRFHIDLRGEEVDNKQMRDDLITLLIAGHETTLDSPLMFTLDSPLIHSSFIDRHETTAAVLTWLTYALSQHPEALRRVQDEIDTVVGDRYATVDDIKRMPEVQKVIAETLRMWPAPPLFIRCATEAHQWPAAPLHLPISPQISSNLPIGGPVARGRDGRRGRLRARSRERPLHLDVQHGPLAPAVGGAGRLRPAAVGPAVRQPGRQGVGGLRPRQAHRRRHLDAEHVVLSPD